MKRLMNYVGGTFVEPAAQKWFSHLSPSTGDRNCEVPDSEFLDVVRAIQAAHKASAGWAQLSPQERAESLNRLADRFESASEELALIQSTDQGMPVQSSKKESLPKVVETFRSYARLILNETSPSAVSAKSVFYGNRMPIGVVGILTPWSDPLVSLALRVAPALAAGNSVVCKPSEHAPESAQAFAEVVDQAGLPSGVFNLVQGRGESAGRALVQHPGLSTLSFTGQTENGREILRESAEFLKKTQLFLGARNPVLVFGDIDLEKAMPQIVKNCFSFHGQTCQRGSRLFVQENVYKRFLELFEAEAGKMKIGDPASETTQMGPLVSDAHAKKFQSNVSQALAEKGKLLFGGEGAPSGLDPKLQSGFYVRPTAVYDLTLCSTLQQEEVIGPLVTIASFKYQHEAIKQANNSPFGQVAYLYMTDVSKAARVALKLEAGRVFVNAKSPLDDSRLSFGGIKNSGLGRDGAMESIRFFSRETVIAQDTSN